MIADLAFGQRARRGGAGRRPCARRAVRSVAVLGDGEVESVLEQHLAQPRRRAGAVGGDHDPVPLGDQLGQPCRRARSPSPPTGPQPEPAPRASRAIRRRVDRPERAARASSASGSACSRGNACRDRGPTSTPAPWRGRPPRQADRWPGRASAAARSARPWRGGSTSVISLSSSTSHGTQDSMPSKCAPSASRSHCSRPHGSAATSSAARRRTSSLGRQLAGGEDRHLGEVVGDR